MVTEIVFLLQYWAGIKVMVHVKKSDYDKYFGKENVLLIMNHTYEIDWSIGWVLCENCRMLGVSFCFQIFPLGGRGNDEDEG